MNSALVGNGKSINSRSAACSLVVSTGWDSRRGVVGLLNSSTCLLLASTQTLPYCNYWLGAFRPRWSASRLAGASHRRERRGRAYPACSLERRIGVGLKRTASAVAKSPVEYARRFLQRLGVRRPQELTGLYDSCLDCRSAHERASTFCRAPVTVIDIARDLFLTDKVRQVFE